MMWRTTQTDLRRNKSVVIVVSGLDHEVLLSPMQPSNVARAT